MPTRNDLSPHRILRLTLTIPFLLLFAAAGYGHVPEPVSPSYPAGPILSERHGFPAGPDDDVLKDALPAPPFADDETSQRLRVARLVLEYEPRTAPRFPHPGSAWVHCPMMDSLMESLLLSRPPPISLANA